MNVLPGWHGVAGSVKAAAFDRPTFRAASAIQGGGTGGSITVNLPAGITSADFCIMQFIRGSGASITGQPSGWTQISTGFTVGANVAHCYYRRMAGGESDPQITLSGSTTYGAKISAFVGCHATTPTDYTFPTTSTASSQAYLTGTSAGVNRLGVHAFIGSGAVTITEGAGWTEVSDEQVSSLTLAIHTRVKATSGATSSGTATFSGSIAMAQFFFILAPP